MNEDVNNLESSFKFKSPVLTGIFFLPNHSYQGKDNIGALQFKTKLIDINTENSEKDNIGKVELEVSNFDDNNVEKNNGVPYLLSVSMRANFLWPKDWSEETIKGFIKVNAASLLFSYIRPIISDITGKSEFSKVDLPFVDFSKSIDKDK